MNLKEELKNAICNNDIKFLEKNKNNYSINERFEDEDNDTLLMYSISDPLSNVYDYLLEHDADVTLLNDEGENIIHSIVFSGDIERLKKVINKYKVDINHQSKDGSTPLILSVSLGHYEIFKYLIEQGADVNISDYTGNKPIHVACILGYLNMVYDLIEKGVDLMTKTVIGNYPLALAVNNDHHEVVKFLYNKIYKSNDATLTLNLI